MVSLKQVARSIVVLGLLTAIAPSATAQSIPNGKYANTHPDNQWVEIRNN
jgi:hypothetical protein